MVVFPINKTCITLTYRGHCVDPPERPIHVPMAELWVRIPVVTLVFLGKSLDPRGRSKLDTPPPFECLVGNTVMWRGGG